MPIISVIIPCYNVSPWIDRCLRSVTEQTIGLDRLEIICVDDCSTDDTVEKLLAWEARCPEQFLLVRSETNGRQGAARNIGLSYASAEWIAFIDADDWVEPDYLEQLYRIGASSRYQMVLCDKLRDQATDYRLLSPEERHSTGKPSRALSIRSTEQRKALIHLNALPFSAWGRIIRRDFLIEHDILFPEGLAYEDIYWGSLINYYVRDAYLLEERLYHYFINPASTVLLKDAGYHPDCLTVNSILWREVHRRGLDKEYRDEIEYELFYSGLLAFLKVIALRFETAPYSLYRLLCAYAAEHIPEYQKNPYYRSADFPEQHRLMLDALYTPMTKAQFEEFIGYVRRIGL